MEVMSGTVVQNNTRVSEALPAQKASTVILPAPDIYIHQDTSLEETSGSASDEYELERSQVEAGLQAEDEEDTWDDVVSYCDTEVQTASAALNYWQKKEDPSNLWTEEELEQDAYLVYGVDDQFGQQGNDYTNANDFSHEDPNELSGFWRPNRLY